MSITSLPYSSVAQPTEQGCSECFDREIKKINKKMRLLEITLMQQPWSFEKKKEEVVIVYAKKNRLQNYLLQTKGEKNLSKDDLNDDLNKIMPEIDKEIRKAYEEKNLIKEEEFAINFEEYAQEKVELYVPAGIPSRTCKKILSPKKYEKLLKICKEEAYKEYRETGEIKHRNFYEQALKKMIHRFNEKNPGLEQKDKNAWHLNWIAPLVIGSALIGIKKGFSLGGNRNKEFGYYFAVSLIVTISEDFGLLNKSFSKMVFSKKTWEKLSSLKQLKGLLKKKYTSV